MAIKPWKGSGSACRKLQQSSSCRSGKVTLTFTHQ